MRMNFDERVNKNFLPALRHLIGQPCTYLEVGVFQGTTAKWVLDNILTHPEAKLIGIDPWDVTLYTAREVPCDKTWVSIMNNINEMGKNSKVRWLKGYSWKIINERYGFKADMLDAVYIDGEHTLTAVLKDFTLVWPCLKVGGVIIFDDYESKDKGSQQVKAGVDYLLNHFKNNIEVLFKNRQVGIRRIS